MAKTIIVTGAGSGIGRDYSIALLNQGFSVVLAGRTAEKLEDTVSLATGDGESFCVTTDVSAKASVKQLFEKTKERFGSVDVLFNNAGVSGPGVMLEDMEMSDWQRVVDTNLTGMFLCIQEAFNVMKLQEPMGGRIINNGSISAHVPRPNSAPYTATKHAVSGLTKSAGLDGRKYNIAVSQIDIGNALTSMAKPMTKGVPQANGEIKVEPTMDVKHVTDLLLYITDLPLGVNVPFVTVMATAMPYIGRG